MLVYDINDLLTLVFDTTVCSYTAKNATDLMQVVDSDRPDASLATSFIKPVDFIKLNHICEHQTCCNLIFADSLQVDETTCI